VTKPVDDSVPSVCLVYHRPPVCGSTTICSIGADPMWWSLGHHDVMSAVKSVKARSGPTSTTISRRIGSTVSIMGCRLSVPR
jgi:hypothetical protein